ncbi:MAG: deaminase [Actinobacteria bacterium HGW-Actinobacteria-1]|jgi:dihydrofolate reductase|nr:MAG: deaminase [Actinobacteria bacterium HGW-Actinobacteria-1]
MRDVVYIASVSVDGFLGADDGDNAWVVPDPELHRHFNALEGDFDAHLYGRRMYELMAEFWPTADELPDVPDYIAEYARIWRAMPKLVFSNSLQRVEWNSRLYPGDAVEHVARLKAESGGAMSVGGTALATSLAQHDLIDEFRLYVMPTIVGSGTSIFRDLGHHIDLATLETEQFASGAVLLRYRARPLTGA